VDVEELKRIFDELLTRERLKFKNEVGRLKSRIAVLTSKLARQTRTTHELENSNRKLNSIVSPQQMKKLMKGKPRWTTEDIVKALTVRSISLKAYETAALVWKYPLPSVSTLRRFAKNFTCAPGVLSSVVEILKQHSRTLDPLSRLTVLMFDEMGLDGRVAYDPTLDSIASRSKVQVS